MDLALTFMHVHHYGKRVEGHSCPKSEHERHSHLSTWSLSLQEQRNSRRFNHKTIIAMPQDGVLGVEEVSARRWEKACICKASPAISSVRVLKILVGLSMHRASASDFHPP